MGPGQITPAAPAHPGRACLRQLYHPCLCAVAEGMASCSQFAACQQWLEGQPARSVRLVRVRRVQAALLLIVTEMQAFPCAGYLVSVDAYMNLQLASTGRPLSGGVRSGVFARMSCSLFSHAVHAWGAQNVSIAAEEYIDGELTGNLGEVLIRCAANTRPRVQLL